MPAFVEAVVEEVLEQRPGLQKLRVVRDDGGAGNRAYVLTQLIGDVTTGDRVVLNVTAVELGLGTGGWHFVHWNLSRHELDAPGNSHQMKLRFTSLQFDTATAEEDDARLVPDTLEGCPVVCCLLASQAATVVATIRHLRPTARIVLVVSDHNSLPVAFSDLVHEMKQTGLLASVISAGHAFGGDHEAVNVASALGVAKGVEGADVIVVSPGPGSLGTGSRLGFSTLGVAASLDDAHWYGGEPVLAVRYSDADQRARHRGISHHTATILSRAHRATVAVPAGSPSFDAQGHAVEEVATPDPRQVLEAANVSVTTMGRTSDEDPGFFTYAAAAGALAASRLG